MTLKWKKAGAGQVSASRKKFRGTLERTVAEDGALGWQIVWSEAPVGKPGQIISKKRAPAPVHRVFSGLARGSMQGY